MLVIDEHAEEPHSGLHLPRNMSTITSNGRTCAVVASLNYSDVYAILRASPFRVTLSRFVRPDFQDYNLSPKACLRWCMFPGKPHRETPIERMFRQVFCRNMNRAERRHFLRRRKAKPNRY